MATPTEAPSEAEDRRHMAAALALAARGLGNVYPNPAVGCVLVQPESRGPGRVVGRGWTQPSGRPHAETEAILRAGPHAGGATAYISLEPCAHHGKTPPCAEALIGAGIARVVVAVADPDPRVSGAGIAKLRDAGVAVETGLLEREAAELNAGFFMRVAEGRPLVNWKTATTLDGRIGTHGGESKWITGETARDFGHALRANHDAIMIGIGTVLSDDPLLTCRLPGLSACSPLRIVVDARLRVPLTGQLVVTAREHPTWLVTLRDSDDARRKAFADCGLEIVEVGGDEDGNLDISEMLQVLGKLGLTRILLEGGSQLAGAFLRKRLIDRITWFRAPRVMGGDGIPAATAFGVDALAGAPSYERIDMGPAGTDAFELYARRS